MKSSLLLLTFLIGISLKLFAQPMVPGWLKPIEGAGQPVDVLDVVSDEDGYIYITGSCYDTLIIDNISLSFVSVGTRNAYVAKLDQQGNAIWALPIDGPGIQNNMKIALNSPGHIYISGIFNNSYVTLGNITLNQTSGSDNFIARLDSSGQVLWALSGYGNGSEQPERIVTDAQGNVILIGETYSTAAIDSLGFGNVVLENPYTGTPMQYIFKFNNSGNVMWGRKIYTQSGLGSTSALWDVDTDPSGNILLCGGFWASELYFSNSPFPLVFNTNPIQPLADIFFCKYDPAGSIIWAKSAGTMNGQEVATGIAADSVGNFYLAGAYDGVSMQFIGPPLINMSSTGQTSDVFLVKYNSLGNAQWSKAVRTYDSESPYDLICDKQGDAIMFAETDIPANIYIDTLLYNDYHRFLAEFSGTGVVKGGTGMVESGYLYPSRITEGLNGSIIHVGKFSQTITYNGIQYVDPPSTGPTGYVAIFYPTPTSLQEAESINQHQAPYPNPSAGNIQIPLNGIPGVITIINSLGETVFNESTVNKYMMEAEIDTPGIYFVRIDYEDKTITSKVIIVSK